MNRDYVLFHLKEALEEINKTIKEITTEADYDDSEFSVAMAHLYHHINSAWNARNASDEEAKECSEANFQIWRHFPTDIDMEV